MTAWIGLSRVFHLPGQAEPPPLSLTISVCKLELTELKNLMMKLDELDEDDELDDGA